MIEIRRFRKDERGTAAIEMALGLPILILFIFGIFRIGVAFQASAGMQHALGEGARLATLCLNPSPTTGCAAPTDAQIKAKVQDKVFGTRVGTFSEPTVTTPPTTECTKCRDVSVTFTMPMDFVLMEAAPVTLTRTKRVYLAG